MSNQLGTMAAQLQLNLDSLQLITKIKVKASTCSSGNYIRSKTDNSRSSLLKNSTVNVNKSSVCKTIPKINVRLAGKNVECLKTQRYLKKHKLGKVIEDRQDGDTLHYISHQNSHANTFALNAEQHYRGIQDKFIKNISKDVNFSKDTLSLWASPGRLPYDQKMNMGFLFDTSTICSGKSQVSHFTGPKLPLLEDNKHIPCNMKAVVMKKTQYREKEKKDVSDSVLNLVNKEPSNISLLPEPSFHYQSSEFEFTDRPCKDMEWDTYILSKLSHNTGI